MKRLILFSVIFFAAGIFVAAAFFHYSDKEKGMSQPQALSESVEETALSEGGEEASTSEKDAEIAALKEEIASLEAENQILKEAPKGFYQKLKRGYDVNILINGDSIGNGNGASEGRDFASLLKAYLEEEFGVSCNLTNISMGGNSSYAGYVRENLLDDGIDYDLAIICYGENDGRRALPAEYEAIIRSLHEKYDRCSIIAVLESSQKDYTEKIESIKEIAGYYGIPVADTIAAFKESGLSYDDLTVDDKHPNDEGYRLYFESIRDIIDERAKAYEPFDDAYPEARSPEEGRYEGLYYIPASSFERVGELVLRIPVNSRISGFPGIYHTLIPGGQRLSLYADGELYGDYSFDWPYEDRQETIGGLDGNGFGAESEIRLEFSSPEAVEGFKGIIFTGTGG